MVDRGNRHDLRCSAAHEHLACGPDVVQREPLLDAGNAGVTGDLDDRFARDSREGGGDGWCRQAVAVDDAAFIATSFPGFTELMRALGADFS